MTEKNLLNEVLSWLSKEYKLCSAGNRQFRKCRSLRKAITLAVKDINGIHWLEDNVFGGCHGWCDVDKFTPLRRDRIYKTIVKRYNKENKRKD